MMKKILKSLVLIVVLTITNLSFGQASFNFTSEPEEFHPDGRMALAFPISWVLSNVPNDADNAINLRFYPYPDGISTTDENGDPVDLISWTASNDRMNMTMGLLNDEDVNNGFYRTETEDNGDGTFTKTYTVFDVSSNGSVSTYKNGGIDDEAYYAPIVRLVHANGQPRFNNSGEVGNGNGNNPLIVDQATLDQSPDVVATHLVFSYYPPEENGTTGGGEFPHIQANSFIDILGNGSGNQIVTFDQISEKSTTAAQFTVLATSTSGLTDMIYTVESGPATISGNTVTLSGDEGVVTLKAEQVGNADFNAAEGFTQFQVIDVTTSAPMISTRLTEDYPLEMPSFYAYPIYVTSSVEESGLVSINSIEVSVDGEPIQVVGEDGFNYGLWTPTSYGTHTVEIIAYGSNGVNTTITKTIEVTDSIADRTVKTMDEDVIEFGTENSRDFYGTYTMPQHVGSYDRIIANLLVECPSATGDCDNWDRRSYIDVKGPDGNWIQIIRYITPYGVGCSHSIDLTDYASLLQGEVEFRMFIDTFGTGGWQISLDLDFQEGTPEYLYSNVDELWDGFWNLGDPSNLQPIPDANYTYKANVLSSHLRLSNTGHGWGPNNSQNAAEFYNATNYIDIDGTEFFTQNLWNTCDPNPDNCSPQSGTWRFDRAGWCPGTIAQPDIVDMTEQIASGTVDFGYRLDPTYEDFCHPNNPNCVTGVTCDDCNDGFNPRYHIDGQLINFSNTFLVQGTLGIDEINNTADYKLVSYPNPSNGKFNISTTSDFGKSVMQVISISGEILKTYVFDSSEDLNNTDFDLSSMAAGIYFVSVENNAGTGNLKLIIQ